ncbi:MAG: CAP domain-containing protein [Cyanobacteria bacterium P01_H01_bin.15]
MDETILVVSQQGPLRELGFVPGLSHAARDHVMDIGPAGVVGHKGTDKSTLVQRIERYGTWRKRAGENITFGPDTGRLVVLGLIVDDGVPDRGHRKVMFNPEFRVMGVACGPHEEYHIVCIMTYTCDFSGR